MRFRLASSRIPAATGVAVAVFFLGVLATTLIGISRFSEGEIDWASESRWLLAGTILIAGSTFLHALMYFSGRHALGLLTCSLAISLLAEWSGIHFGVPFGARFAYHEDLTPRIFGSVPLFIPFAWFSLLYAPLVLLDSVPTREKGRDRTGLKILLAAVLVTASDLYLDPLAIDAEAWTWERPGKWFGVPLSNFAGWWLVGGTVYGIYHFSFRGVRRPRSRNARSLQGVIWVGIVLLTAGVLFCLNQRIESGWKSIATAYSLTLTALAIWRRWGRLPEIDSRGKVDPASSG